ncbi:MAG: cation diffusion facilitator family transporter [Gammaproteobacteria bacterium]|nr:cation diffusion facilitator family transporter [Gammaproteobacteria bacterium]
MPHNHSHDVTNYNRSFALGVALNIIFVVIEVIYGISADSIALIADAGHNLSDVMSLLLAWGANRLATKHPTSYRTYGFRRVTILASLVSAFLLLVALGGITFETFERIFKPQAVDAPTVIIVAAIGVVINTATALLFIKGQKHDLNIRAAYLHMAADAGISLGVVIAGIAILFTGFVWLDPVISLLIVVVILISTWSLLKEYINLSIDAVPQGIDITGIKNYLSTLNNVTSIHDLHIWALSTTEVALTVHLVTNDKSINNPFLEKIQRYLHDRFDIEHSTIQIESASHENGCLLNNSKCI